jgi:hypothetical protein
MAALASLAFLYPWVLAALLTLPLIWWLLRIVPPQPKSVSFPAMQFLYRLKKDEHSSATTPWWLLLLRLIIAALIILAIAGPVLNFQAQEKSDGEVVIFIDDGWTSAQAWEGMKTTLGKLADETTRDGREVFVLPLSTLEQNVEPRLQPLTDREALGIVASIEPKSWPASYAALPSLLPRLEAFADPEFIWLSGNTLNDDETEDLRGFFNSLAAIGPLTVYQEAEPVISPIIKRPAFAGEKLTIPLVMPTGAPAAAGMLTARGEAGQILASTPFSFTGDEAGTEVTLNIPNEIRNDIRRLEIADAGNAGAVYLLDQRWQRRQVGLVVSDAGQVDQPLLNETHYLTQALAPFFDIARGSIEELLAGEQSLIVLGDTASLPAGTTQALTDWIAKGGVLIRFAGPKLANASGELVPVELRSGNRDLQGAMSWNQPMSLGRLPEASPFAGLMIPPEVTVTRQVLANPSPDLIGKTWAQLEDGTPLVTAAATGAGWIVLFHTTATPEWSNLALSGLFVEMLREIGNFGQYTGGSLSEPRNLPPYQLMTGFGRVGADIALAEPLNTAEMESLSLDRYHPPGYYGDENFNIALNIGEFDTAYSVFDLTGWPGTHRAFEASALVDLMPPLLLAALLLILIDQIISLYLQGRLPPLRKAAPAAAILLALGLAAPLFIPQNARAQAAPTEGDARILAATLDTRLGYILTKDYNIDSMSHNGLVGLSRQLRNRTAVEAEDPLPIDIERDELIFYPFIYWPVTADFPALSERAILKLNDYFQGGGTILFDTRNQNTTSLYGGDLYNSPENTRLRELTARLDIPRIHQVPPDHVITRAFYLMQTFPGRYDGGDLWVQDTTETQGNDGVASVIIGSNDWAAAWAVDTDGRYQAATPPGGERQRELAYRFGINLVMYTLTGNYKADQVHVPAILERLGQ